MQHFGPFVAESVLGRGGMGVVYRARHHQTRRPAAVKTVLRPGQGTHLEREVRALARISHPGVARVLDWELGDGDGWYAMELVEGRSLRDAMTTPAAVTGVGPWLDDPFAPVEVPVEPDHAALLPIMGQLCLAVAHLHSQGLVHGDLKPSNVVVREQGPPVLVDFGLASMVRARESAESLAVTAQPAGTFGYLAPEVLRGEPADARADLYALACMVYELLAGHLPYRGGPAELLRLHAHGRHVPLAQAASGVDPALARLVDVLLDPHPARRRGSALELALCLGQRPATLPTPPVHRAALCGREALLAELERALETPRGVIVLCGEPGVGKTRVAMELVSRARARSMATVSGAAGRADRAPLSALRGALSRAASTVQGVEAQRSLFGPLVGRVTVPELEVSDVEHIPGAAGRRAMIEATCRCLEHLARQRPTLLLVDDVQWADELSVEVLVRLATSPPDVPLLVVCTSRVGDEIAAAELLAEARRVDVGLLSPDASQAMLAEMLGADPPPALATRVAQVAGRSPFWIAETVRAAVARGVVEVSEAGRWTATAEAAARLPGQRDRLVPGRLETLSARAQAVARSAALLDTGRADALRRLSGLDEGAFQDALWELEVAGLLFPAGHDRWSLAHAVQQDAIYETIPPLARVGLHRAAAEVLEALDDANLADRARHWDLAGEPERARTAYHEAADRAFKAHAVQRAAELVERALALTEGRARLDGLRQLDLVLKRAGDVARRRSAADEAWSLVTREDPGVWVQVALQRAAVLMVDASDYDEATALSLEALEVAEAMGDHPTALKLCSVLAHLSNHTGQSDSLEWARRGLAHAEATGDLEELLVQRNQVITCLWRLGRDAEALAAARELLVDCEAHGEPYLVAQAHLTIGAVMHDEADMEACRHHNAEAARRYHVIGDLRSEAVALCNVGSVSTSMGELAEGERHLTRAVATLKRIGARRMAALAAMNLATNQERAERFEVAARTYEEAARVFEASGDHDLIRALAFQARALRHAGAPAARTQALLERARERARSTSRKANLVLVEVEAVHRAMALGGDGQPELAVLEQVVATLDTLPANLREPVEGARSAVR